MDEWSSTQMIHDYIHKFILFQGLDLQDLHTGKQLASNIGSIYQGSWGVALVRPKSSLHPPTWEIYRCRPRVGVKRSFSEAVPEVFAKMKWNQLRHDGLCMARLAGCSPYRFSALAPSLLCGDLSTGAEGGTFAQNLAVVTWNWEQPDKHWFGMTDSHYSLRSACRWLEQTGATWQFPHCSSAPWSRCTASTRLSRLLRTGEKDRNPQGDPSKIWIAPSNR